MTEETENSGDPLLNDRQYGPDLSGVSPARRRFVGFAMIAAFVAVVLFAVLAT